MLEIKVTIEAPGLAMAVNRLADAIAYSHTPAASPNAAPTNPSPGQTAAPMGAPAAPATAQPMGAPAPAAPMTGPAAAPSDQPTNPTPGAGYASTVPTGAPAAPMAGPTSAFPSNQPTNPMPVQTGAASVPTSAPAYQTSAPASTCPSNPVPQPGVPVTTAPQYTVDQIMQAGATLMDAGRVDELVNLLHTFGVQAVTDLKPEQMGAFATALRGLGAKI